MTDDNEPHNTPAEQIGNLTEERNAAQQAEIFWQSEARAARHERDAALARERDLRAAVENRLAPSRLAELVAVVDAREGWSNILPKEARQIGAAVSEYVRAALAAHPEPGTAADPLAPVGAGWPCVECGAAMTAAQMADPAAHQWVAASYAAEEPDGPRHMPVCPEATPPALTVTREHLSRAAAQLVHNVDVEDALWCGVCRSGCDDCRAKAGDTIRAALDALGVTVVDASEVDRGRGRLVDYLDDEDPRGGHMQDEDTDGPETEASRG